MKFKKNIIVEIKGGFGNQVFQYMFANKLRNDGFKVKVNTRFYDQFKPNQKAENTYRSLVLPPKYFDFKNISYLFYKFLVLNNRISNSRKLKRVLKNFHNPLYVHIKDKNYNYENPKKFINHFDGYWQNIDFLVDEKDYLIRSLSNNKIIKKSINVKTNKNSAMLLVRRGDYLKMNEELSLKFYEDCLKYLKSEIKNLELNIFTDDVDWVKNQNIFSIAKNIYGPEEEPKKVIELFALMLNHLHFVITNSTFSLIAAIISEEEDSKVLVADPWFRNRYYGNLLRDNWVKIENK